MALFTDVYAGFPAGEVSSNMYGRVDLPTYRQSLKICENAIVLPQGAVRRRDGTIFVAEVKNSAHNTRLIPFDESTTDAYVLELGNTYMRFYKNNARIESGGSPVEISTPWLHTDVFDIQYAQDHNTMYLVDGGFTTRKLTRTSDTSWTLSEVVFVDGPYLDENRSAVTMTPSATSGSSITITASSATFATTDTTGSGGNGAYDRLIRIKHNTTWGHAKIVGYTSATVVTATVLTNFDGTSASSDWRLGAFSTTTGFPTVIGMHEQRLLLAATAGNPQDMWASRTGYLEDFEPGTDDDDGFGFTIYAKDRNKINWFASFGQDLFSGTTRRILNHQDALTPTNPRLSPITKPGSIPRMFVEIGDSLVYVQKSTREAFEIRRGQSFTDPRYSVRDLTFSADHVLSSGVVDLSWQETPYPILWFVRNDGLLAGLTYDIANEALAWHRHTTLEGSFESLAVIPKAGTTGVEEYDQVWCLANRDQRAQATCTITVTDAANIAAGSTITITTHDGESTTFTATTDDPPATDLEFSLGDRSNNGVADNIAVGHGGVKGINALAAFSAPNPAANVITVTRATPGGDNVTVTSSDPTRIAVTNFVNGTTTKRYVEYFDSTVNVDSAVVTSGSHSSASAAHLENWPVTMTGDGAVVPSGTVSSGSVALGATYTASVVGLAYTHTIKTQPVITTTNRGISLGQQRRTHDVILRLNSSLGSSVNGDAILYRKSSDPMDTAPPVFTGDKLVSVDTAWSRDGEIIVSGSDPYDFELVAMALSGTLNDA